MKIEVANVTGFCSGVNRAVKIAQGALFRNAGSIYSLGPIIHNPQIIHEFSKKGLRVIKDLKEITKKQAVLILPSHGYDPKLKQELNGKIKLIDVTCPYVNYVQKICAQLKKDEYKVVITGDKNHTEIKVLLKIAPQALVVDKIADLKDNLLPFSKIGIISQTTQDKQKFFNIVKEILKRNSQSKEIRIFNTICLESQKRQEAVNNLSKNVDVMLIIGGKDSANTRRLVEICRRNKVKTYYLEDPREINLKVLSKKIVGLAGGCSTPENLIKQTLKKLRREK